MSSSAYTLIDPSTIEFLNVIGEVLLFVPLFAFVFWAFWRMSR